MGEFGLAVGDDVEVRVVDSTADLRYLVLPQRPEGTEGMTEEELIALVTRDSMIGIGGGADAGGLGHSSAGVSQHGIERGQWPTGTAPACGVIRRGVHGGASGSTGRRGDPSVSSNVTLVLGIEQRQNHDEKERQH